MVATLAWDCEDSQKAKLWRDEIAVDKSRLAINLLKQKGSPEDVTAYRDFLLTLGDKVANAAKEGGFLGFGGERVSEHERSLLAELTQAIGVGNLAA